MITSSTRKVFFTSNIAMMVLALSPTQLLNAAVSNQEESAFARRMMTMDRNKDGFLTTDEIPKSLIKGIMAADLNEDGKWTAKELSMLSQEATKQRSNNASASSTTQSGTPRPNRARQRRRPARSSSGPGSPLDAAQILKFALTFDLDKDSGLNPEELRKYAAALAVRRSEARRQREAESPALKDTKASQKSGLTLPSSELPDRAAQDKKSSGLKAKSDSRDADPFGSGKKTSIDQNGC